MEDKLAKKRARAERATEDYADTLVKERNKQQKRRNGRLIKLGVALEQMVLAGDTTLLARAKVAIVGTGNPDDKTKPIASRAVDRTDFALDEPLTWFDEMEQKALEHRAGGAREMALSARPGTDARPSTTKKDGVGGPPPTPPDVPLTRAGQTNGGSTSQASSSSARPS